MSLALYQKQKRFDRIMRFLTRYEYADGAVQLEFRFPSRTEQHHKESCDVNVILRNFMKTGVLSHSTSKIPLYGDFSGTPQDYSSAVKLIQDAEARFAELPSEVRERFGNDPLRLLEFLDDPANADAAADLGLIKRHIVKTEPIPDKDKPAEQVTPEGGEA